MREPVDVLNLLFFWEMGHYLITGVHRIAPFRGHVSLNSPSSEFI